MPERIKRQRTKGWRMPEGAIYVGRPTAYGNPFDTAEEFRRWLTHDITFPLEPEVFRSLLPQGNAIERDRDLLRGHDLACWCPLDRPCHADVLLELANRPIDSVPPEAP